jgi:hypothetical protein
MIGHLNPIECSGLIYSDVEPPAKLNTTTLQIEKIELELQELHTFKSSPVQLLYGSTPRPF